MERRLAFVTRRFYRCEDDRAVCVFVPAQHRLVKHRAGNDKQDHVHKEGEGHRQPLQQCHPKQSARRAAGQFHHAAHTGPVFRIWHIGRHGDEQPDDKYN